MLWRSPPTRCSVAPSLTASVRAHLASLPKSALRHLLTSQTMALSQTALPQVSYSFLQRCRGSDSERAVDNTSPLKKQPSFESWTKL